MLSKTAWMRIYPIMAEIFYDYFFQDVALHAHCAMSKLAPKEMSYATKRSSIFIHLSDFRGVDVDLIKCLYDQS